MADDNAPPRNKLLALATLLKDAVRIEDDLTRRLSRHPKQKSLLKLRKEYRQLVGRLNWELERTLARYLTKLRAANGSEAGPPTGPSARASSPSRPKKRRQPRL